MENGSFRRFPVMDGGYVNTDCHGWTSTTNTSWYPTSQPVYPILDEVCIPEPRMVPGDAEIFSMCKMILQYVNTEKPDEFMRSVLDTLVKELKKKDFGLELGDLSL
jgi:hypothetical protein